MNERSLPTDLTLAAIPQESSVQFSASLVVLAVLVVLVAILLFLQWLNHSRKVLEAKLKTAETLAREGLLDRAQLESLTRAPKHGRRLVYFVAWLIMLAGIFCFIMSGFSAFYSQTYVMRGVTLCFVSTAIFATPVLFREIEKQGWI